MCRVHVRNPTYVDYYMKDWFIRNDCIRIFSKQKQTDIGMLHSDLCIESNPCLPVSSKLQNTTRFVDENMYAHMESSHYMLDGEVN